MWVRVTPRFQHLLSSLRVLHYRQGWTLPYGTPFRSLRRGGTNGCLPRRPFLL